MEGTAMLIIIDKKASAKAKKNLKKYGELIELETNGITYEAISGHPDIFFCKTNEKHVVAPNLPTKYIKILDQYKIEYEVGNCTVGAKYPQTAPYNAYIADDLLIHNLRYTDKKILEQFSEGNRIHINQGYTRCNLLFLGNNTFITSDKGIEKELHSKSFEVLYIDPKNIKLEGFKNGFIGGCAGILDNKFFFNGTISKLTNTALIKKLNNNALEIIEIDDKYPIDIGSIIFL